MPSEDAKTVKKDEVKDEDEETLGSFKKKKPSNATPKEAKVKNEENKKVKKEESDEDFEQNPLKKSSNKSSDKVGSWCTFFMVSVWLSFFSLEYFVFFIQSLVLE